MTLTSEEQQALASFPEALRQLVQDELACGNSIVEVGHSFPAPPAGAYIKLANIVSTRPRASGSDLSFRARNSPISSGEFTDERRFYFVIEPPSPPEPELDMDAIRREHQSREDARREALVARAQQVESVDDESPFAKSHAPKFAQEVVATHSPSGVEYTLNFDDSRPPHEIQFALERIVCVLFIKTVEHDQLCMRAKARVNGASYALTLTFVAATPLTNSYVLHGEGSWAEYRPEDDDYFRRTSGGWFGFWTRDFRAAAPPRENERSADRYREVTDAAMQAEAHLDSVDALKQAIVAGMKRGGTYLQSHKEGGTDITWRAGAFVRTDYGDDPGVEKYADEASFLQALRQFCSWDIVNNAPTRDVSDVDAWRLILRRMSAGRDA